ncbi:MAG: DUF2461 domain-containing protein [Gammaproteobacteria bacterium HGW-Gammaproteobacteria-1]|nr:MAG: DUF2461 domain-containing protein [Gammaproteobacteria bacterium HGW-Gammaproteobacteria-1]
MSTYFSDKTFRFQRALARNNERDSLFRIHRDTRFSNDKTPYKPWAGLRLYHQRHREVPAPSFYVHIAPGDSFVGGGLWHPDSATTRRVRSFIADNPAAWKRFTHAAKFRERCTLVGDSLVRPPAGFPADHPLIEDLKRKDFVAVCALDDATVTGTKLIPAITERLALLAPLIDYLCAALELEY